MSLRSALIGVGVLGAVHTAFLSFLLLYPDLNLDYPFMGGDSFDWISQALRFAGHEVRDPGRPPLFPLLMAGMEKVSLLHCTPVLLQTLIALTTAVLYRAVAEQFSSRIALPVSVAFFVNYAWRSLGLEIMADVPAACLMVLSLVAFFQALERPKKYVLAGFLGGLSALTQPLALLLLLPEGCAIAFHRRGDIRTRWPWFGLILYALPVVLWTPFRLWWFGSSGAGTLHWSLLGFHPEMVPSYLWAGASFLGVPGLLLGAGGFVAACRQIGKDPRSLVLVTSILLIFGFFSVAYGFAAKRFLVYTFVLAPFFWAEGLGRFRRATPFAVVSLVLIGWSWFPYPDRGSSPSRLAVWPAPATYLATSLGHQPRGDARPDFAALSIERSGSLLRHSVTARAWSKAQATPQQRQATILDSDGPAVFLSVSATEDSRRYVTVTRLGNALRRRVKFVSREQLRPFVDTLPLRYVGRILGWDVFRTRLPGLPEEFLVVISSDDNGVRDDGVVSSGVDRKIAGTALETAEELLQRVPAGDDVVAVLTRPEANDALLTYLAFLAPSSNFYVIETDDPSKTLIDLGCDHPVLLENASEIVVDSCRVLEYDATVVLIP